MSREKARIALTTKLEELIAAMPSVQVERPNDIAIDPDKATAPFVRVDIQFPASYQGSLGTPPHLRVIGMLTFTVYINTGKGTKTANDLVEYFSKPFSRAEFDGARCHAVSYGKSFTMKGWRVEPAIIPFWFDDFT
jgi:hypothetical protein